MRVSSLRLFLLALVARVLSRWLHSVTTQLESDTARQPPDPADSRSARPAPPDHWVELVRQHAPRLLDSDEANADSSLVIDWRSDDALDAPSFAQPNGQPTPKRQPERPLRLHTPKHPAVAVPPRTTAPKRPLRLERVAAQADSEALDDEDVIAHSTEAEDTLTMPDFVRTTTRAVETTVPTYTKQPIAPVVDTSVPRGEPTQPPRRFRLPFGRGGRRAEPAPANVPAVREVPTTADKVDGVTPHYAHAPFEHSHVHETQSTIPNAPAVPTIRTGAGGNVPPRQQWTGVSGAPPQVILRPTHTAPPLNIADITADRWASLPDAPAEEARESNGERRERLKREQEGRAWSE